MNFNDKCKLYNDRYVFKYEKYKIHFPYPYSFYAIEDFNLYESFIYIYFKDIDIVIIYDTNKDLVDIGGKYEDSYHWYKPSKAEKEEIGKIYHREVNKKIKLMFKKLSDDI